MAEAPPAPPAPPAPVPALEWVILSAGPRVAPDDSFPPGEHVALREGSFVAPPAPSYVTMSRWMCRDETTPRNYPSVIAVDPSGTFLLYASQGRADGPHILERPDLYVSQQREFHPGYILSNPFTRLTGVLPNPERPVFDEGNLGLIADPNNPGDFAVAELQLIRGTGHATLLVYSTAKGRWDEKEVRTYARGYPPTWRGSGAVSHDGRLWWVDLSLGLFACDPFVVAPQRAEVRFVPLPDGCVLPPAGPGEEGVDGGLRLYLEKYRCVRSVAGRLRYAQIDRDKPDIDFSMWSLADDGAAWELDHRVPFADIWAHPSYQATGLAKVFPMLMLLHPRNPDVVYFWLLGRIFPVDLRARVVLDCKPFHLDFPPQLFYSSRAVHAWELPATPPPLPRRSLSGSTIRSTVPSRTPSTGSERDLAASGSGSGSGSGVTDQDKKADEKNNRCLEFLMKTLNLCRSNKDNSSSSGGTQN